MKIFFVFLLWCGSAFCDEKFVLCKATDVDLFERDYIYNDPLHGLLIARMWTNYNKIAELNQSDSAKLLSGQEVYEYNLKIDRLLGERQQLNGIHEYILCMQAEQSIIRAALINNFILRNRLAICPREVVEKLKSGGSYFSIEKSLRLRDVKSLEEGIRECEEAIGDAERRIISIIEGGALQNHQQGSFASCKNWSEVHLYLDESKKRNETGLREPNLAEMESRELFLEFIELRGGHCLAEMELIEKEVAVWCDYKIRASKLYALKCINEKHAELSLEERASSLSKRSVL